MFPTAVCTFRSGERTYRSGEYTFRSAEYKPEARSEKILSPYYGKITLLNSYTFINSIATKQ